MKRTLVPAILLGLVVSFSTAGPANAQNLLTNPDFTANLDGWTLPPVAATTHDAATGAASGPGSALWTKTIAGATPAAERAVVFQCVNGIMSGETYDFGGAVAIDTAPAGGSASMAIAFNSGGDCSGLELELHAAPPVTDTGPFDFVSHSVVAPPATASATVGVIAGVAPVGPGLVDSGDLTFVTGDYVLHVDDMFLLTQTPVPTIGTLWLIVMTLALIVSAAATLRRRHLRRRIAL